MDEALLGTEVWRHAMNSGELTRDAVALACGVTLLALGGWYAGLRGLHADLGSANAERSLQRVALAGAPGTIEDVDSTAAVLESRIREARSLIAATPGPETIYDAIQRLARDAGVRLDRLEPTSTTGKPEDPKKLGGHAVESLGFDAEITGDYDKVVAFIAGIENDLGMSKVLSLRVAPLPGSEGDRTAVLAKVTSAHYVQVTDVLRSGAAKPKEKR
jgi:hypothetical protein